MADAAGVANRWADAAKNAFAEASAGGGSEDFRADAGDLRRARQRHRQRQVRAIAEAGLKLLDRHGRAIHADERDAASPKVRFAAAMAQGCAMARRGWP